MTLDQINYVLAINKTGSFSRAAENLFISQSALSLAMQNLEKELGRSVFTRTSKGVFPTAFGKTFIQYISPISIQFDQINSLFFSGRQSFLMSFVLANDGFQVASEAFVHLFRKYQHTNVYMKQLENYTNEAKSLVSIGQADIGFVRIWSCYEKIERQQMKAMGLIFQPVAELDLAIGVGPKNPLFDKKLDSVEPSALKDFTLIEHEYMDGSPYEDILARIGVCPTGSRIVTSSRAAIEELVRETDAYFISANTGRLYENTNASMRMIPLKCGEIKAELGWIARKGDSLNSIAMEYTELLENRFLV